MLQNPPTDNLYKFITFLGVALIIFSAWTYIENTRKIEVALLTAEFELQSLNSQADILENEINGAVEEATTLRRKLQDPAQRPNPNSAEFATIESRVKQLEIDKEENLHTLSSIKQRNSDLRKKINNAKITAESLDSQNTLLIISFLLGCAMAVSGFGFWYCKHQKYQDELLKSSIRGPRDN